MFCFLQVFLSLFSAGLMALAIPNEFYHYGNPFLGIICLVPLYIALSNAKSYRRTFLLCFLHGAVTHLLSSYWLSNFQGMAAFTLGASTFGTAMIEGLTGLLFHYPYTKNSIFKENLKKIGIDVIKMIPNLTVDACLKHSLHNNSIPLL